MSSTDSQTVDFAIHEFYDIFDAMRKLSCFHHIQYVDIINKISKKAKQFSTNYWGKPIDQYDERLISYVTEKMYKDLKKLSARVRKFPKKGGLMPSPFIHSDKDKALGEYIEACVESMRNLLSSFPQKKWEEYVFVVIEEIANLSTYVKDYSDSLEEEEVIA